MTHSVAAIPPGSAPRPRREGTAPGPAPGPPPPPLLTRRLREPRRAVAAPISAYSRRRTRTWCLERDARLPCARGTPRLARSGATLLSNEVGARWPDDCWGSHDPPAHSLRRGAPLRAARRAWRAAWEGRSNDGAASAAPELRVTSGVRDCLFRPVEVESDLHLEPEGPATIGTPVIVEVPCPWERPDAIASRAEEMTFARGLLKAIALLGGAFITVVSLMAVAGTFTDNAWIRLGSAIVVMVGPPLLLIVQIL